MIAGLTLRAVALFLVVVAGQIGGSVLLGLTAGFTRPGWSALCALVYAVSLYSLATLIKEGAPLSLLMPILAENLSWAASFTLLGGIAVLGAVLYLLLSRPERRIVQA